MCKGGFSYDINKIIIVINCNIIIIVVITIIITAFLNKTVKT